MGIGGLAEWFPAVSPGSVASPLQQGPCLWQGNDAVPGVTYDEFNGFLGRKGCNTTIPIRSGCCITPRCPQHCPTILGDGALKGTVKGTGHLLASKGVNLRRHWDDSSSPEWGEMVGQERGAPQRTWA